METNTTESETSVDADEATDAEETTEEDAAVDATDETDSVETSAESGKGADEQFCSSCGEVIKKDAEICPECGVSQSEDDGNPGVAALLSGIGFIIPIAAGAGQIYNGELGKGIALSVLQLINVGLAFMMIGLVTYPIVGIYAIYDAYTNA